MFSRRRVGRRNDQAELQPSLHARQIELTRPAKFLRTQNLKRISF
jgi:hypothetical protein